ncbi:hypothetical protein NC651_023170 [Populus alba x Populus x berolinensis]|nr:hypothetical protein NC651_023170 [Populus alba x Populus x berolinensis]
MRRTFIVGFSFIQIWTLHVNHIQYAGL